MKYSALVLFVLCFTLGCATPNHDLRTAEEKESHDWIDFKVTPSTEEQNAFAVIISLRRDASFVSITNGNGYSRQDGQTIMNFPSFIVRSEDEAEIRIGENEAKVFIDDKSRTVRFSATFVTERGTVSASGTVDLGANQAR